MSTPEMPQRSELRTDRESQALNPPLPTPDSALDRPARTQGQRLLGGVLLVMTLGLVSCQSLFLL